MNHFRLEVLCSILCILVSQQLVAAESTKLQDSAQKVIVQKSIGTALNKDKQFFYTEEDNIEIVDDHIRKIDSSYKDKDSKLMVEMHADFSKRPYFPEITFSDHRKDVGFKILNGAKENTIDISQNLEDQKDMKTKTLNFKEDMMNSMGLINYIRENIASLKLKRKSFRYVVPALMDDYGMSLEYRENTDPKDTSVRFAFRLKSFFIRNIAGVKESLLSFDEKHRFIKSFNGVSNILDDSNKPVEVEITYSDPTETKTK